MKRSGALIAALFLTSAAQAADLNWNSGPSTMYSPSPVATWSGFYAGINGGFGWGTTTRAATGGGVAADNNSNGWVLGGQLGYNADMGGFVIGGEADLQWSNVGYAETLAGAGTFRATTDLFGTIRARAGLPIGQVMPYVTGGLAMGRGSANITNGANVTTSQAATHYGWTAGIGLEAKATDNISIKAEYSYTDLGTQTYNGLPGGNIDVTQRFGTVRAGINYSF